MLNNTNSKKFAEYIDRLFMDKYDEYYPIYQRIQQRNSTTARLGNAISDRFRRNQTDQVLASGNSESAGIFRGIVGLFMFFSPYVQLPENDEQRASRFIEFFGDNGDEARQLIKGFAEQLCFRFEEAIERLEPTSLEDFAAFFIQSIDSLIMTINIERGPKENTVFKLAIPPREHALYNEPRFSRLEGREAFYSVKEFIYESEIQLLSGELYEPEEPITRNKSMSSYLSYFTCLPCSISQTHASHGKYMPKQRLHTAEDAVDGTSVLLRYRQVS